jgi:hypothetical protein
MERIGEMRSRIYDFFHGSDECQEYFFDDAHSDEYARYYTSMYLLQDSTEGLLTHMITGFNENPLLAYIEMWGVMQAIIIQQDSISTLYKIIMGSKLTVNDDSKWKEVRVLRNQCAGHPGNQGQRYRSFFGRGGISYTNLQYERKDRETSEIEHPRINYQQLINEYAEEAYAFLSEVEEEMRVRWPSQG